MGVGLARSPGTLVGEGNRGEREKAVPEGARAANDGPPWCPWLEGL